MSEGYFQEGQHLLAEQVLCTITEENPLKKLRRISPSDESYDQSRLGFIKYRLSFTCLAKGVITKKDLHEILPHLMHLVTVQLQGRDLIRLAAEIAKNQTFLSYYHQRLRISW